MHAWCCPSIRIRSNCAHRSSKRCIAENFVTSRARYSCPRHRHLNSGSSISRLHASWRIDIAVAVGASAGNTGTDWTCCEKGVGIKRSNHRGCIRVGKNRSKRGNTSCFAATRSAKYLIPLGAGRSAPGHSYFSCGCSLACRHWRRRCKGAEAGGWHACGARIAGGSGFDRVRVDSRGDCGCVIKGERGCRANLGRRGASNGAKYCISSRASSGVPCHRDLHARSSITCGNIGGSRNC